VLSSVALSIQIKIYFLNLLLIMTLEGSIYLSPFLYSTSSNNLWNVVCIFRNEYGQVIDLFVYLFFKVGSHYIAQTGFKLRTLLLYFPLFWNYRCSLPHQALVRWFQGVWDILTTQLYLRTIYFLNVIENVWFHLSWRKFLNMKMLTALKGGYY
jgi:hypothetical protein